MLGLAAFFWLAGFDVIYSLQDCEFDREQGHSISVAFGIAQENVIYWLGFAAVTIALFWEYRIVSPNDFSRINRAFFNYNAYVSIGCILATITDSILNSRGGTIGWA